MKLKNKNSNQKVSTGKKGELVAERYLIKKGYEVLDKNYRKKVGEIDIICKKDDILHFVEVKTVKVPYPVELNLGIRPEDKLTKLKVGKIRTVGGMYIKERGLVGLEYKIDAIAVYLGYTNKILQRVQVKYIPAINV
jgi:putative endonuclease